MKLSGPTQIGNKVTNADTIQSMVTKIERQLSVATDASPTIVITDEYSLALRQEIVRMYVAAGWRSIEHKTSSENGERPGLTRFQFLTIT